MSESKPKTTVVARSQAMTIPSGSGGSSSSGSNGNNSNNSNKGGGANNNNNNSNYAKPTTDQVLQQQQQQSSSKQEPNIFFGSTPPMEVILGASKLKSNNNNLSRDNKRLQSVSLDTISSSLDSPDLEVKRIMMLDDSSSIGSLDSYNAQLMSGVANSMSSNESIDVLVAKEEATSAQYQLNVLEFSSGSHKMSIDSSVESISEKCNNLVLQEPPPGVKVKEVTVAETESVDGGSSRAENKSTSSSSRTRKTSWIPANQATIDKLMSIFQNPFSRQSSPNDSHHQNHNNQSHHLHSHSLNSSELENQSQQSVQQNQSKEVVINSNLTTSSVNSSATSKDGISAQSSPTTIEAGTITAGQQVSTGGSSSKERKDNSLGNLFNWAASGMKREDKTSAERLAGQEEQQQVVVVVPVKQSGVLNTREESSNNNNNNISNNREVGAGNQSNANATTTTTSNEIIQLDQELIADVSLMNEIKENISPEHTITATAAVQSMRPVLGESSLMRVKFQLGSTEDFDELLMAEDEELGHGEDGGGSPASRGMTSDDSCLSLDEGGIGQIARDSMVIFNTSGGSSGCPGGGAGVKASSPITSKGE